MGYDLKSEISKHLGPNETLLWVGSPKKGILFSIVDIFLIPFSILWCSFAIFWLLGTIHLGLYHFAPFGVPLVYIGLMMVFGRFIVDALRRKHTIYGLTDKRIIIQSGVYSTTVKSLHIKSLANIECEEKSNGSGTIILSPKTLLILGPQTRRLAWGNGMSWWPGYAQTPSLYLIKDVREVYRKLIEIKQEK